jgi:hypothetical protein
MSNEQFKRNAGCVLLFMFLLPFAAFAQESGNVRVLVQSSQQNPEAGSTWTLTLLIEHGDPNEVNILAPPFTDAIFLDQMIKAPRVMGIGDQGSGIRDRGSGIGDRYSDYSDASELRPSISDRNPQSPVPSPQSPVPNYEQWTVTEYHFTLTNPGTVFFDSFTIITPHGEVQTEPFELNIRRQQDTTVRPRYTASWRGIPRELKIGESADFSLSVNSWRREIPLPDPGLFFPVVPPGHILEFVPSSPAEREAASTADAGAVLKLRLIPLTAVPFVLEKRQIVYGGVVFEIPAVRIPVSRPAAANTAATNQSVTVNPDESVNGATNGNEPPFPSLEAAALTYGRLYSKYQTECAGIFSEAKNLWERGRQADALAVLRRNERDHGAGKIFSSIRREAEQSLGLTGTNNEKKVNPFLFWRNETNPAVMKETAVRRIPDSAGTEIARFREGQPVLGFNENGRPKTEKSTSRNPENRESWMRVITNDSTGASGWVPEENIIFY